MADSHAAHDTAHSAAHGSHDAHGHDADPNAAPMRADVQDKFSSSAIAFCAALAAIAIIAGTLLGVSLVNN